MATCSGRPCPASLLCPAAESPCASRRLCARLSWSASSSPGAWRSRLSPHCPKVALGREAAYCRALPPRSNWEEAARQPTQATRNHLRRAAAGNHPREVPLQPGPGWNSFPGHLVAEEQLKEGGGQHEGEAFRLLYRLSRSSIQAGSPATLLLLLEEEEESPVRLWWPQILRSLVAN